MRILICPSKSKRDALRFVDPIAEIFLKNGQEVFIDDEFASNFHIPTIGPSDSVDIIIALGGDGTIIFFRHKYLHMKDVKIVSLNLGGLGFMAAIRIEDFETYLLDILEERYQVEDRLMLEVEGAGIKKLPVINDVVVHRGSVKSMILLKVYIDGNYFNTFQADGIIFATPTGSTAYSMATGGPILSPLSQTICVTPISPHSLTARPVVIASNSNIEVEYLSQKDPVDVTIDGLHSYELPTTQKVRITPSPHIFKLITFPQHNTQFFANLRQKLHWSGTP